MTHYTGNEKHTRRYWENKDKDGYTCPRCGATEGPFEVHHINENPGDGRLENLVALCRSCHWEDHKQRRFNESTVEGWKRAFREEILSK